MGNLKDPEKRNAKLKEARENYFENALEKAALNAWSGQVLAIGYKQSEDEEIHILEADEEGVILEAFAHLISDTWHKGERICGFNIEGFDLPFMARRAMKLGIPRAQTFQPWPKNYYDPDKVVDLMKVWQCGNRQEFFSLDRLARFLNLEGKEGEVTGKDFWKFYEDPETRGMALEYLENDVRMTTEIANRLLP